MMERVNIGYQITNKDVAEDIISSLQHPTKDELKDAWKTLWTPFAEFPYVTVTDRSVVVAALLTAAIRKNLVTAPAFCFIAPPAGGKTLLARSIAELAGKKTTSATSKYVSEKLFIYAAEGRSTSLLFDNIQGKFQSVQLNAWLKDDIYIYQDPYNFETSLINTQMMVLIAGTNVIPIDNLERRVLTAHLDPKTEHAERRNFRFDVKNYCREHHQRLISAALTLITGFVATGSHRISEERLSDYEMWDDLVRQCVLWLNAEGIAELSDPVMENSLGL